MVTRESRRSRGARRGGEILSAAIHQLRDARVALGLSQAALAAELGVTQSFISRIEANLVPALSFPFLSQMASLLGLEPSLTFHQVGNALRDKGHQAVIRRLLALLSPAWRAVREVRFPNPGDPRYWDIVLRIAQQVVGVEAETRIRDVQALVRRMRQRVRDGGTDITLLVLSDTAHNRSVVAELREALGAEFSTPSGAILEALRSGSALPGSGVILI